MSGLRTLLREHTAADHTLLEATELMRAFAAGSTIAGHYREYLRRQWRLHAALEPALADWFSADWVALRLVKTQWLSSDLQALEANAQLQPETQVPAASSHGAAFGILYVLEGATLGLYSLRRRLQQEHAAWSSAQRFIEGYGAQTAHHWHGFVAQLDTLSEPDWPQALSAASATFGAFQRVFAEPASSEAELWNDAQRSIYAHVI